VKSSVVATGSTPSSPRKNPGGPQGPNWSEAETATYAVRAVSGGGKAEWSSTALTV
jgi:hypothetical protein